ncbi:uncharacterized protein LOC123873303 [Maniola jurtina]|uniref:uncharacterized protein LOC123873303 n=1 Tax=Maniola jurtina TaxID=191418 RepID=UPI001E68B4CE|nr:uncharacterized protein LOC123873303 [Maniola jurtina]
MADFEKVAVESKRNEAEKPTNTLLLERKDKFVFDQCCFCVPLITGCLVLAYLFLVGTVVIGIFSIYAVYGIVNIMPLVTGEAHHIVIAVLVLNAVTLVLALISIPFNLLLLFGLHKERRSFLKVYLMFQLAYLIISELQNIVTFSLGFANIVAIVISLAGLVFNIYYILVIRSQYIRMGTASNLPRQLYRHGHEDKP